MPWLCVLAFGPSCAGQALLVRQHAEAGRFEAAVKAAGQDPDLLAEAAAAVLERGALSRPEQGHRLIAELKGHAAGLRSLHALAREGDERISGPAQVALFEMGEGEEDEVRKLLSSNEPQARADALSGLRESEDRPDLLLSMASDPAALVRRTAALGLASLSFSEMRAAVLRSLAESDPDPLVRAAALRAGPRLGERGEELCAKALESDPAEGVRLAAIEGLDAIGTLSPLVRLRSCLGWEISQITLAAAWHLAARGEGDALQIVRAALSAKDGSLRAAAAIAAGQLQGAMTGDLLKSLEDPIAQVRLQAALSLQRTGADSSSEVESRIKEALLGISKSDSVEAAIAAGRLAKSEAEESRQALSRLVSHVEPGIRAAAGSAAAEASLWGVAAEGLSDPDPRVREATAGALLSAVR